MKTTPLEDKITQIVAPVVTDMGYALFCVRLIGEGGGRNLQIMAENPQTGRLGLDDCTNLSKAISAALDVEDPIDGAYRLEISSPGIDRLLLTPQHFADYAGFEAKIETAAPTETGQKRFRGRIQGVKDGDAVTLATDQGEVEIPCAAIVKAKLVLTDELIKAKATS